MVRTILRTISFALLLGALAPCALAQGREEQERDAEVAKAQVAKMFADAGYSLTKTGFGSADRVIDPGTMYAFRIEGLISRTVLDHVTPTNVIGLDGKLVPPAKGFVAAFGAGGDFQQVNQEDRYYLHEVTSEDNTLIFTFLSVNTTELVVKGASARSRLRMYLKFQLPKVKGTRPAMTPEQLHALTDPIFLPAGSADSFPSIHTGDAEAEVRKRFGDPDKGIQFDNKTILFFKGFKVVFIDGKVVSVE